MGSSERDLKKICTGAKMEAGLAVRGCEAERVGGKVSAWAKRWCKQGISRGCEPQLISHAAGNMRIGNDKAFLIKVISQCLPYIGYPRSLNALRCVNEAAEKMEG